jgi:hypothetical protein
MLAAGEDRQHGGNEGYDDVPERHYQWDDTVAHHGEPQIGHIIALWDKRVLLGASVIESITESDTTKDRLTCPQCNRTSLKRRKKKPAFRCYKCPAEFNEPLHQSIPVHTYRSNHEAGWVDLGGLLDAKTLRSLCVEPKSIQSIRHLKLQAFRDAVQAAGAKLELGLLTDDENRLKGGHKTATVRVRIGQSAFRRELLDRFGPKCAFTGHQHTAVLDAAHLYRYAKVGEHHKDGGMLLRKDLHRLFDLGMLSVDPTSTTLDVAPELKSFSDYADLHGKKLAIVPDAGTRNWLRVHWKQHRT